MVDERQLVAVLHRADWTRLSLSGEVHGANESVLSIFTEMRSRTDEPFPPSPPFPPFGFRGGTDVTLLLAPGKRYREESADGQFVRGCDGERVWQWLAELPPTAEVRFGGGPQPPLPTLLAPSWLLSGYQLTIEDETTMCGRTAIRVVATARHDARRGRGPVALAGPPFRWPPIWRYDRVVAVVDAELGVLLRCERWRGDKALEPVEFRSLTVDPEIDPARFTAPEGSVFGEKHGFGSEWSFGPFGGPGGWPFGGAGREVAKTAAGLAAGGLGAAIKYTPFMRVGPSRQPWATATDDDPEAAMPRDDPFPGDGAEPSPDHPVRHVSDEVLHLLYRSGADVPRFTATLHEWVDGGALLEAVPESARGAGFGGVGFLVDTLRDAAQEAGRDTTHEVRTVWMGGWDEYRIDLMHPEYLRHGPLTVACDGQRHWEVYVDRVLVGPAAPPPNDLVELVDGSWLLGCDLSGGEEITVGDRRAYRVSLAGQYRPPSPLNLLTLSGLPAVVAVDAESGRLLRLTRYTGGKPVTRHEFRDVAPDEEGDFGFEVPAGLRVVEQSPDDDQPLPPFNPVGHMAQAATDAVKQRMSDKVAATRGLLDSLRGTKPPTDM